MRSSARRDLWFLLIASLLAQLPFLHRGLSFWDEGSILAIADGLRQGERLYADRVTPVAPLTYELVAALLRLFGPSLWPGRVLLALVLSGCVLAAYAILVSMVGRRAALLGALSLLALKPLGFPLWTIVNYSQVAMLWCLVVVLCVLRFLPEQRSTWLFAAGIGVGLTVVTKQNLGAMIAAIASASVALDWLREGPRRAGALVRRAAVLVAGAGLVVVATLAVYAVRGTLGALVERAVLGTLYLTQPYFVPLPGFELWALRPFEIAPKVFAYFPSPLFDLMTEGKLDVSRRWPLVLAIEQLVKAAYYVPVLLLALGVLSLAGGLRSRTPRAEWSRLLAIVLFAAASYASMLYRADWTHLTNIYPGLLLLAAILFARGWEVSRLAKVAAVACGAIWIGGALGMSAVVLATYRTPVETPRGRLLALVSQAAEAKVVLGHLAARPRDETVLFLRTDPLYYFLGGLRIPTPFDLVVPGYLAPEDDARLAERLREIDQVVYDPAWIPTMPTPITEYAPRTSAALANGFRVDRILGANSFALDRRDEVRSDEETVVDLWEGVRDVGGSGGSGAPLASERDRRVRRASWLVYRVISMPLRAGGGPACFESTHRPRQGESVSVLPMLSPVFWILEQQHPRSTRVRFEIRARAETGPAVALYSEERSALPPPSEVRASLDAFAGREIEIDFCAELARGPSASVVAGWGEPKIVRRAP